MDENNVMEGTTVETENGEVIELLPNEVREIPNAQPINSTISPNEVKDSADLYNVNQTIEQMELIKESVLGNYKDDHMILPNESADILNSAMSSPIIPAEFGGEIVDEPVSKVTNDTVKKFATVKFYSGKDVIYRFDLWTTNQYNENGNKLVQLKNIINNFDKILPQKRSQFKDFFATVGLIRYVFAKTMFPIGADVNEESLIVTLENTVSDYIRCAKISNLKIDIAPATEDD